MNKLEIKKEELKAICVVANKIKGIHSKVAKKCKISDTYSRKIRNTEGATLDRDKNIELISSLVKAYRKELENHEKELNKAINNQN